MLPQLLQFCLIFASASASAMWKLQDDNLFQTSSNGNDYNLTTYGNPEYNIPYPGDSIYLAVDIKFPEPISNVLYSSMELLYYDGSLVDIIYVNTESQINVTGTWYTIPSNLPWSWYHSVRINVTYVNRMNVTTVESVALGHFQIGTTVACEGLPAYNGAISVSDLGYSSLHILQPDAGQNLQLVDTGITAVKPEFAIQWDYYNTANALGHGISNILMEFVQKSNKSTGYISAGVFPVNSSSLSVNYPYGADTVDQEGLWYVRVNYTNVYQESPNGPNVTYLSQPFLITRYNETNMACLKSCADVGQYQDCSRNPYSRASLGPFASPSLSITVVLIIVFSFLR